MNVFYFPLVKPLSHVGTDWIVLLALQIAVWIVNYITTITSNSTATPASPTPTSTQEPKSTTTTPNQVCNDVDFNILNDASRNIEFVEATYSDHSDTAVTSPDWKGPGNIILIF